MEQIEAFWNGVLVGKRKEGELDYECRQIDGVYVEYRIIDGRFYSSMRSFKNPDLLAPYLGKMNLGL